MTEAEINDERVYRAEGYYRETGRYPQPFFICYLCADTGKSLGERSFKEYPYGIDVLTGKSVCIKHLGMPGIISLGSKAPV